MTNPRQPVDVFLSHFAEERSIAECLQDYLRLAFGEDLNVFRSSDEGSISTGDDQYQALISALSEAKVYIIFVSKYSATRPWLNFETGFGKGRDVALFPVLVRGASSSDVPSPLSQMQLRPLTLASVVEEIIAEIANRTGRTVIAQNTNWFLAELRKKESAMPNRELLLIPFRFTCPGWTNEGLGFEISYQSPRPLNLVKVWAEVPWAVLDPNWSRAGVTGHLNSDAVDVDGEPYLRREYLANTTVPNVMEAGAGWRPLHPHLAPADVPTFLRELRFALHRDLNAALLDKRVRGQIIADDGATKVQEWRLGDLEIRQNFRL